MQNSGRTIRQAWVFFSIGALFLSVFLLLFFAANLLLVIFAGLLFGLLLNGMARLVMKVMPVSYHWALGIGWFWRRRSRSGPSSFSRCS